MKNCRYNKSSGWKLLCGVVNVSICLHSTCVRVCVTCFQPSHVVTIFQVHIVKLIPVSSVFSKYLVHVRAWLHFEGAAGPLCPSPMHAGERRPSALEQLGAPVLQRDYCLRWQNYPAFEMPGSDVEI